MSSKTACLVCVTSSFYVLGKLDFKFFYYVSRILLKCCRNVSLTFGNSSMKSKVISFSDENVKFSESTWWTPAIWLDVPDDWRNQYST